MKLNLASMPVYYEPVLRRRHPVVALVLLLALLGGCSSGSSGGSAPDMLAIQTTEPAGANCANGGTRVDSGPDGDGDGVLDLGEIVSTAYVCDDSEAADTVVTEILEPAGSNCANGGTRIDAGPDSDGDGVLDAGEIVTTSYVCDADEADTLVTETL